MKEKDAKINVLKIPNIENKVNEHENSIVSVNEQLSDIVKQNPTYVNVKAFGADSSGVTNSVTAFQTAIDYMNANNINVLYIPSGTYKIVAGTNTKLLLNKNITVMGDGESSVIKFDDTPTVSGKTYAGSALFCANNADRVEFKDLRIEGGLFDYLNQYGNTNAEIFFYITNTQEVIFNNVTLYGSRTLCMQVENCTHVKAINSTIKYSLRDGFRLINCSNVIATNNYFLNVSDDSITVAMSDAYSVPSSGADISNNIFEFSQGVKCLGSKIVNISDNIFKRCHYTAINVANGNGGIAGEGNNPATSITISNNTFAEHLKFTASNDGDRIIEINGGNIVADTNGKIPSVTISPYAYTYSKIPANGAPALHGLKIHNNKFIRTLPNVATVDSWGYGQLLDRSVSGYWINSAITDSSFAKVCLYLLGCVYDCTISENTFSGTGGGSYGVWFYGAGQTYSGIGINNVKVINNHFYDLSNVAMYITNTYKKANMIIEGNTFDVDPFFRNSYHFSDNTWDTVNGSNGTAIGGTDLKGVIMRRNTFANCYKLFSGTPSVSSDNVAYAQGSGATATNKGIYDLSKATAVIAIDGDPTSATFRQAI